MMNRQDNKDAFTHVMGNVLDFQSGNLMDMAMDECGYDKINDLSTTDKDEVMDLNYSKRSTDTP